MKEYNRYDDFMALAGSYASAIVYDNQPLLDYLNKGGFFTAPASTKYHGVYDGGLYDHSRTVFERLRQLSIDNRLEWQRPESPFIIGMFHDLCKCDQYKKVGGAVLKFNGTDITEPTGYHYEYNNDIMLKGHGSKSVMILSQFMTLTNEEMLCIRFHMGAYEKDEWPELDLAIRCKPNILYTHLADMLASKIDNT